MNPKTDEHKTQTQLLDIPSAAHQAGYPLRHFRKIIEEDRIPVLHIAGKCFITMAVFEAWNSTRGEARLEACIKQLDRLLQEDLRRSPDPVPSFEDEE